MALLLLKGSNNFEVNKTKYIPLNITIFAIFSIQFDLLVFTGFLEVTLTRITLCTSKNSVIQVRTGSPPSSQL